MYFTEQLFHRQADMSSLQRSCRIAVNAAGDWQVLPPPGQITQIGDAKTTEWALVDNDDLFVTGKFEVGGDCNVTGLSWVNGDLGLKSNLTFYATHGVYDDKLFHASFSEEVTIPVGQGMAGVLSLNSFCREDSIVLGIVGKVTQAPGGGATTLDIGRNGGNTDEFADGIAVTVDTPIISIADGDGVITAPFYCTADAKLVFTTDANVTGTDMKVYITVFYMKLYAA